MNAAIAIAAVVVLIVGLVVIIARSARQRGIAEEKRRQVEDAMKEGENARKIREALELDSRAMSDDELKQWMRENGYLK